MANTRISDLTASASNLASTDLAPVVQTAGVGPVKMTGLQLAGGLLGSATFNGATVTTSQPVLNLTQTWNDGAVTFTGLKFNATDTASASGSLLLDLQVGGTSKVSVSKNAQITAANTGGVTLRLDNVTANYWDIFSNSFLRFSRGPTGYFYIDANGNVTISDAKFFAFGSADTGAGQTFLRGPAAATLQLGAADAAAPVAQFFKVQGVVAGTSNTAGANFTIQGSQGTGTGAGGSIIFQVAPAGSSSGTAQNGYSTLLSIDPSNYVMVGPTTRSNTFALSFGLGTSYYTRIYNPEAWVVDIDINPTPGGANSGSYPGFRFDVVGSFIAWSGAGAARDVRLYRDGAPNTLALRNGTSAQTFNIYGTYTASDNFERLAIQYGSSSDYVLRTEKGGSGGSNRSLSFETYGATTFTIAAQTLSTSSDGFYSWSTTTSSRGSANTRLYRDADGIIGVRGSGTTSPAAMSFYTYGASPPASPAASIVRIYADTSGGKIRLMALFPSGAAQQIAIEP